MWKNPFNKSEHEDEENQAEMDAMAENARKQIESLMPIPEQEEEFAQQDGNIISGNMTMPTMQVKATTAQNISSGMVFGVGGGGSQVVYSSGSSGVWNYYTNGNVGMNNPHHEQGVCQESYDKGYEDGLAAGKSGETRL